MSEIPQVPAIGDASTVGAAAAGRAPDAPGAASGDFGAALQRGVEQVSALEDHAGWVAEDIATGGESQIHDLMIATNKSELATELLVQTRNRAVEAYQEIMRLPV